ncbi:MAG: ZIP family metal transporter [Clostridia bacterium]|nr:ZIP family metal transporter [Clostridia bacterium]
MQYTLLTVLGIGFIFISTTLGASSVYFFKKDFSKKTFSVSCGFAAGVMLAASIWSLLLPAIEQTQGSLAFLPATVGFLFGGVFMLLFTCRLNRLKHKFENNPSLIKSFKMFFAVTLHNVPEGLAVGFAFGAASSIGTWEGYLVALGLAFGIGIQNLPEGAAVALPLKVSLNDRNKAFLYGVLSGVVEPVFAVLGYFTSAYLQFAQAWLLAFSAGTMVYVVVEDLLPDATEEQTLPFGVCGVMLGFALMMALDVALG